jgi:SdrD B-like domain
MNRGIISTQVLLYFLIMTFLMVIGCSKIDDITPTYNISGAVSGDILAGVTINLTGVATASTTTDASGNYSFTGRANGTYTVIPVMAGYTFNPVSSVAFVSGASVTNTNFVATATSASTYSISGTVTGAVQAGVTMTLSGTTTGTAVTNASGYYSFSGLADGSYTVTPTLTGYTFTPANLSITLSSADSTGNNFTSVAVATTTYSMSGAVSGTTLAGVTINLTGAATTSTTTDTSGNFSITGLYNGAYTVTPVKTGYTFTPSSTAVTVSGADITGKDFMATVNTASKWSISGVVSGDVLSGVTITLSGDGSATTTTNSTGNYSFSYIVDGSYTVTPSLTGYTFSPTSSAVSVSGANITGTDFVATSVSTTYTQADITGTWNMNLLRTGFRSDGTTPRNEWMRARITLNSSGVATCVSMSDSTGVTTCPSPFDLTFTMNTSTGVIFQSGVNAADNGHMTMTSNKKFMA